MQAVGGVKEGMPQAVRGGAEILMRMDEDGFHASGGGGGIGRKCKDREGAVQVCVREQPMKSLPGEVP